jgi:DNA-binding Xre family transcriptional regulator
MKVVRAVGQPTLLHRLPESPLRRFLAAGSIRTVELAAAAGCGIDTLRRVAHGDCAGMRIDTLLRISAALGVAPAELVPALATRPKGGLLKGRGVKK